MARSIHSGNTGVLGHRVGADGRPGEPERALADSAPRIEVLFWCTSHEIRLAFSVTAKIPEVWQCRCGKLARREKDSPQVPSSEHGLRRAEHLARIKERRSPEQAQQILDEALARLHERRLRDQAASQDVLVLGPVASAILPASLVGGLVASGAILPASLVGGLVPSGRARLVSWPAIMFCARWDHPRMPLHGCEQV
jgi:hypothetical protein